MEQTAVSQCLVFRMASIIFCNNERQISRKYWSSEKQLLCEALVYCGIKLLQQRKLGVFL